MFCEKCGTRLPDGSAVCPKCAGGTATAAPAGGFGFAAAGSLTDLDSPSPAPKAEAAPAPKAEAAPAPKAETAPAPGFHAFDSKPAAKTPAAEKPAKKKTAPAEPAAPKAPAAPKTPGGFAAASKNDLGPATAARPAVSTPNMDGGNRISVKRELKLLIHQGALVMTGDRRNLIFSLLFPLLAGLAMVWVAGEYMFVTFEATKSACFVLVCAAIWCGMFNSVQSIVKERENIKRDYVSGALRIGCYTMSRAILQLVLCLVQSFVLTMSIPVVILVYGNDMPVSGLLLPGPMIEFFLSLFLLMYAADTLGLLISSVVKKAELASQMSPYILIVQLLFSGVLFTMEGGAQLVSGVMVSRWGMEALGSICDLNNMPLRLGVESPDPTLGMMLEQQRAAESAYEASASHLLLTWGILIAFVVVQLYITNHLLRRVKNDTRS